MRHDVYVGYDAREHEAYAVACSSLLRRTSALCAVHKLDARELYASRMLWRPVERSNGRMIDHLSEAPQSTEFAISRFLVPFLHRHGWALFIDCDMVFLADVGELFALADSRYAVMCVQHPPYRPVSDVKMDGQPQVAYPRKNWSSVVLWNCNHPAHFRLSLDMVNYWPGELLHRFAWLRDGEIGALPAEWNWLVGQQPRPAAAKLAHFTNGGPWLPGWKGADHDEVWNAERNPQGHHAAAG